ncbi:MAG: YceI family protein [Betaproteobacteria bacterium]
MARAEPSPASLLPACVCSFLFRGVSGLGPGVRMLRPWLGRLAFVLACGLAWGLGLVMPVQALNSEALVPEKSSMRFEYKAFGLKMGGKFKSFSARVNLNTARLDQAEASLTIDLASIDTGLSKIDQELMGPAWFHVAAHPSATFVLQAIKPTGAQQFEALGRLEIKGQSREVQASVKLSAPDVFSGSIAFNRADFGVGQGWWSRFDVVANEIVVHFSFTLR